MSGADQAKSDLEGVGSSVNDTGSAMKMALGGAALASGAAIVGVGVQAVKMAGDFQSGITSLQTGAGESAANLKMVSDGILNLATQTGTSTQQLTSGMYMIESAGFHGAVGLQVLQAAAEGAKVGNADLGTVANAVTTVMHDYAGSNYTASQATSALVTTVADGKTHMQDLSSSLAAVLPLASSLHIPFQQVAGAIAMMTNAGVPAQQASQNLAFAIRAMNTETSKGAGMLTNIGLSADQLHNTLVNQGLPAALQLVEDHIGQKWPLSSEEGQSALKYIMGGVAGLNVALDISGTNMKNYQSDVAGIGSALSSSSKDVQGWADVQNTFNFKLQQAQEAIETLMIKLGTELMPIVSQAIGFFTNFAEAIGNSIDPIQILIPVLAGLAAVVIGTLVPAWLAQASAFLAATWPILLVGAAVAGLVAILMHFYQASASFRDFINGIGQDFQRLWSALTQSSVLNEVQKIFQQIGGYLSSAFEPILKQLQTTWQTQLLPAFQQLLPALKPIAELVGGILLVAFGLLIGVITGTVRAFAALLEGAIQVAGGVVQFMTGMIQIVSGVLTLLYDLFTLQWGKIGSDLGEIWDGILNMVRGFGNAFMGFFGGLFLAVGGLIGGFVEGVIGYFTDLFDALVGHSIIPDMINGIINWFQQLPERALSAISSFASSIGSFFTNLASQAVSWGSDMINNFISGLTNAAGGLISKAESIAGQVSSILHFSKPDTGPLADADTWMPDFMDLLASGINSNMGKVKNASLNIATSISTGATSAISNASGASSSFASPSIGGLQGMSVVPNSVSQGTNPIQVTVQPAPVYLDGMVLTNGLMPHIVQAIRTSTGTMI